MTTPKAVQHDSDCARHNETASPNGPCDCSAAPTVGEGLEALGALRPSASVPTEPVTLLPCPFCGAQDRSVTGAAGHSPAVVHRNNRPEGYVPYWAVECDGCGSEGPAEDDADRAITAWNRRAKSEDTHRAADGLVVVPNRTEVQRWMYPVLEYLRPYISQRIAEEASERAVDAAYRAMIAATQQRVCAFPACPCLPAEQCDVVLGTQNRPGPQGLPVAATQQPAGEGGWHVERIHEVMAEGDGFWRACSGCQEGVDGHVSAKDYPYSKVFKCQPGGGCSECGGLGVLWDDTDYDAMATAILADMREDEAALSATQQPVSEGGEVIYVPMPLTADGDGPADPADTARIEHQIWDAETNGTLCTAKDEAVARWIVGLINATPNPIGEEKGAES